ncbi:kunitz-type serine protease inhibitor homolog alpha-dendrotoxin [Drosophila eugracilis]|uniref:kunitz-type serine protease inhibitor homolog alpha-dendrotoxin n=1 Tax=Drosophila eugracilis TaxID=29029 RepID=UPI001BDB1885|nr:kunitz-type serine protease inhibitor homolog alpha-dendrotoxin [Drosophila eugracilis]
MKFLLVLCCLVLCVALSSAQCNGRPRFQDCHGGKDEGVRQKHHCISEPNPEMWYYNHATNQCLKMQYHGCGGNNNRYCSLVGCQRSCIRN